MAKIEADNKNVKKTQKEPPKDDKGGNKKKNDGDNKKKDGDKKKKSGGKKKKEYKPGMSYLYEPCPHRVYTPKPGERDKSAPRGVGSPWYEPVRKKEDIDKEEAEKSKKKEEKTREKNQKAREERQKKKEEEEKKRKKEEQKNEEEAKKKEEKKKQKEKKKKARENAKRKKQAEKREKDKEKKKKEEAKSKEEKGKDKDKKEKEKPQASYMYEPCPHRVYTPGPGERDMADPRGIGSPWYVPVRKKEDLDKEEEEKYEQEKQKRKEERKKQQKQKKEQEEKEAEERKAEEEKKEEKERKINRMKKKRKREIEKRREEREIEDIEHEEMGMGVRSNKTDFTPELKWMMDFITYVDEQERERRGESLRWKKQEIEEEIETHLAKEAYTNDFKAIVSTFIEAEWARADKKLKQLEKQEKRKRREMIKSMDPLAKDLFMEGKRFKTLYKAATGEKGKGSGEGPSALEDMMVGMIMQQMDVLQSTSPGNMSFLTK